MKKNMKTTIILGMQWGDEGKGKITDYLCQDAKVVVKYHGGNNAGHTIVVDDKVYKLHLLPSGVISKNKTNIIAEGVVIDYEGLMKEINEIGKENLNLKISDKTHITLPIHKSLDKYNESLKGKSNIGTTGKGIGPTYSDKAGRIGIRIMDLFDEKLLKEKLEILVDIHNDMINKEYGDYTYDGIIKMNLEKLIEFREFIKEYIIEDCSYLVNNYIDNGINVLFEGSQGTLLDISHGTYPFVTSSSCVSGAVCTGAGVPPTKINKIVGVAKAYTTRVGNGPFPTEMLDEQGELLRQAGHEYGTTTGRSRRCGWLDLVILNYSAMINGVTDIALTKLDTLSCFDEIKVCYAYEIDGVVYDKFPTNLEKLGKCIPLYKTFKGWGDLSNIKTYKELPSSTKKYIKFIEEYCKVPVTIISVGAKREETIIR